MMPTKRNGFEKLAAKSRVPEIIIDLHLKPASGTPLHCFIEKTDSAFADGDIMKIDFSVSTKDFSGPRLSSLLDAFAVRVEIRFSV
jgi:hypothetical protein